MLLLFSELVAVLVSNIETDFVIEGEIAIWDTIFDSRAPIQVLRKSAIALSTEGEEEEIDLKWPEGPLFLEAEQKLLFSDTISAKIYALDLSRLSDGASQPTLQVLREHSGDCPSGEENWRAEPGSVGLTGHCKALTHW
jgi:hypothetical protein